MKDCYTPWLTMRTCPICGKEFLPASHHAWIIGDANWRQELVCTYSCMRKWENMPKSQRYKGKTYRKIGAKKVVK